MPTKLQMRRDTIKHKKLLVKQRLAMTFEQKIHELEEIIEWTKGFGDKK
jgi:hypothetical protein